MKEETIFGVLKRARGLPLDFHELRQRLQLKAHEDRALRDTLQRLETAGRVVRMKGDRFALPKEADLVPGRLKFHRTGSAHLEPDEAGAGEVFVPAEGTGTALHGDRVLVRIEPPRPGRPARRGREGEQRGAVARVLERANTEIVGALQRGKQLFYVVPDDPRFPHDVYLADNRLRSGGRANIGDKVVVELVEWQERNRNPEGVLIEKIGRSGDPGVDVLSVIRQHKLPTEFPPDVQREAERFGTEVRPADLRERRDCRGHDVITIDPEDAKDFDDAICVRRDGGGWHVWVHIADVSNYVKPGTALDAEARRRGNSTYLVDRVLPMLPEALSNELCSLKPQVDRLTKCVEFRLDSECRVRGAEFYPAVIRSRRRFHYKEALGVIRGRSQNPVEEMVREAQRVARRLREARMRAGSLDLDMPEVKVWIDERGRIKSIEQVEQDESHQLIEEFMLLANEAVARHLKRNGRAAVYRVHEDPDPSRLEEYRAQVRSHGIMVGDLTKRAEVVKLLAKLKQHPCGPALRIGLLRSLKRARYAPKPLGHFGLAKTDYTHFTSPIRRYADLVVHRALFEKGGARPASKELDAVAEHISTTERNSAEAEMASRKLKLFAYLQEQIESGRPQVYDAMVTEVIHIGAFVDVPGLGLTGLVPVSSMGDDFYVFDAARAQLRGRRTRRTIALGARLRVQVLRVDFQKMQVDFRLAATR